MALDTPRITERGVATLPSEAWNLARRRTEIIRPLAALEVVGHQAADAAAHALGLSRRQVYILIRRARQGTGTVPLMHRDHKATYDMSALCMQLLIFRAIVF